MEIITAIIVLSGLGIIFGAGLAIAAKRLHVEVDPRLEKIHGLLPGANCGSCGEAGCFAFAEAILSGKLSVEACRVNTDEAREKISVILGKKHDKSIKKIAALHCGGGIRVKDKFIYQGVEDCVAANMVLGGQKECLFGCLGFGTCAKVCPFDALKMSGDKLPVVDQEKCRACNKCVIACPKKLFSLIPVTSKVYVACHSHDIGKKTKEVCPVGCIACKLCEKACKFDAIHVVDNLSVIDYNKCTSCQACVRVCPSKCILVR